MRNRMLAVAWILSAVAAAQSFDAKVVRAIPADGKFMFGVNLEECRRSALASQLGLGLEGGGQEQAWFDQLRWAVVVSDSGPNSAEGFRLVVLGSPTPRPQALQTEPVVSLGPGVMATGQQEALNDLTGRWRAGQPGGARTPEIERLAGSFDVWFIVDEPLRNVISDREVPEPDYRSALTSLVKRASGGIRLGREIRAEVAIEADSPQSASAIAVLAPWIPLFAGNFAGDGQWARLLSASDRLVVSTQGSVVTVSVTISEETLKERIKKFPKTAVID